MQSLFCRALAVAALLLAAGCASVNTKVTNFNAWPQDAAGATFAFRSPEGKTADLEQATYETWVRTELEKVGLRAAAPGEAARFTVEVVTGSGTRQRTFLEPIYQNQLIWVPAYRDRYGNVNPGYFMPDNFGSRYVGDREVTRTMQVSRLKVRMFDQKAGARPVFDSTAVYEGDNEDLPDLVPYLARAVFDAFPGRSGQVRTINFDPRTGEKKTR